MKLLAFLLFVAASRTLPVGDLPPGPCKAGDRSQAAADVSLECLGPGIWLFTALAGPDFQGYPANGLVVEDAEASVLVDPGWMPAQGNALLRWAERVRGRPVRAAVVTHFHSDRLGGIAPLLARGIPVHATRETIALARKKGEPALPDRELQGTEVAGLRWLHPGRGHSPDNIVVWHSASRTLFGGCFVKEAAARDLGNVADADVGAWPASLKETREAFPDAATVVPGHGARGGWELLDRTQSLLRAARR
jgi:metallo-beta-lactamase class B